MPVGTRPLIVSEKVRKSARKPTSRKNRELFGAFKDAPGNWKYIDDMAVAFGVGFIQDATLEQTDNILGLLNAVFPVGDATPEDELKARKGKLPKSVWSGGSFGENQDAMKRLFDTYEHEYPTSAGLGRGVSIIGQILTGYAPIKWVAKMLVRYGLKTTVKIAQYVDKALKAAPQALKALTKTNPDKVIEILSKKLTGSTVRKMATSSTENIAEILVSKTGDAARGKGVQGLTDVGTYGFGLGGPLVGELGKKVASKVAALTKKAQDFSNTTVLESLAKGYGTINKLDPKAGAYIRQNYKSLNLQSKNNSPEDVVNAFVRYISDSAKRDRWLKNRAVSKLEGTTPSIAREDIVKEINDMILEQFRRKGYKPDSPAGLSSEDIPYQLTPKEYKNLEQKLKKSYDTIPGPEKRTSVGLSGKTYKKITPGPDDPHRLVGDSRIKWPPGPYSKTDTPPSDFQIVQGVRLAPPRSTYNSTSEIMTNPEIGLDRAISKGSADSVILKDLFNLRDYYINSTKALYTETAFQKKIADYVVPRAKFDEKLKDQIGSPQDQSAYRATFGKLSHKLNTILYKRNPNFEKLWTPHAKFNTATKHAGRGDDNAFFKTFGLKVDESQWEFDRITGKDVQQVKITSEDPEKTYEAITEALLVKGDNHAKRVFNEYANADAAQRAAEQKISIKKKVGPKYISAYDQGTRRGATDNINLQSLGDKSKGVGRHTDLNYTPYNKIAHRFLNAEENPLTNLAVKLKQMIKDDRLSDVEEANFFVERLERTLSEKVGPSTKPYGVPRRQAETAGQSFIRGAVGGGKTTKALALLNATSLGMTIFSDLENAGLFTSALALMLATKMGIDGLSKMQKFSPTQIIKMAEEMKAKYLSLPPEKRKGWLQGLLREESDKLSHWAPKIERIDRKILGNYKDQYASTVEEEKAQDITSSEIVEPGEGAAGILFDDGPTRGPQSTIESILKPHPLDKLDTKEFPGIEKQKQAPPLDMDERKVISRQKGAARFNWADTYAPGEFLEKNTEIEEVPDEENIKTPELDDREHRKEKVRSFLKQQGAFRGNKIGKRRGFA